jgi:hypothetical protein
MIDEKLTSHFSIYYINGITIFPPLGSRIYVRSYEPSQKYRVKS